VCEFCGWIGHNASSFGRQSGVSVRGWEYLGLCSGCEGTRMSVIGGVRFRMAIITTALDG
jgi:hypothetical protein